MTDNKTVEQESCKENTQGRSCKVNGLSSCLLAYLIPPLSFSPLSFPTRQSPSVPLHSLRSTRRGGGRKEDDTKEERRVQEWNGRD